MKIAVTYDNGNIFQHFGKTENFKVYPMRRKTPCFSYGDIRRVHRIYASN